MVSYIGWIYFGWLLQLLCTEYTCKKHERPILIPALLYFIFLFLISKWPHHCSLYDIWYLLFDLLSGIMHFMRKTCHCLSTELNPLYTRHYASKIDWNKLRPIILNRIRNRVNDYPIKSMIPVAIDVLKSQEILRKGVSVLLNVIPVKACK